MHASAIAPSFTLEAGAAGTRLVPLPPDDQEYISVEDQVRSCLCFSTVHVGCMCPTSSRSTPYNLFLLLRAQKSSSPVFFVLKKAGVL